MNRAVLGLWWMLGCAKAPVATVDTCEDEDARAACLSPQQEEAWYVSQAELYFDTMEFDSDPDAYPDYSERAIRWEWPPWLLLTGYGRENLINSGLLLRLMPAQVPTRDCRFFSQSPFARCRVVFTYEEFPGKECPIYEEFTFNDAGQMTFIEAWSDLDGLRPTSADDPWGEGEIDRLANRLPGLGSPTGWIEPHGAAMEAAAAKDPDIADLIARTDDFMGAWTEAYAAAGDDLFARGCGW